jgi:putative iron-regulated protein
MMLNAAKNHTLSLLAATLLASTASIIALPAAAETTEKPAANVAANKAAKPAPLTQEQMEQKIAETYADIAYAAYSNAYLSAKEFQAEVEKFLFAPAADRLGLMRELWLALRRQYMIAESHRFYDGPMDVFSRNVEIEGPESRLNGWPIQPGFLDDGPKSLIAGKRSVTSDALRDAHRANDEREITTGFHALEQVLWGVPKKPGEVGNRTIAAFEGDGHEEKRRREFLVYATEILAHDILYLQAEWGTTPKSYRSQFLASPKRAIGKMLTGLATLSGYEIPGRHLGIRSLDGLPPALQSPYSRTSHADLLQTAHGIRSILLGEFATVKGTSLLDLIARKDQKLADALRKQNDATIAAVQAIPEPMEQTILLKGKNSDGHKKAEIAAVAFVQQAKLLIEAGKLLDVPVEVTGD